MVVTHPIGADLDQYQFGFHDPEDTYAFKSLRGFIEPISRELPMEYSVELNRLIQMEMEGSVG